MEVHFRYTPAGTVLTITEWDWSPEELVSNYYHIFEDAFNGPFINYHFIDERIEFETPNGVFVEFNLKEKKWRAVELKESIIIKGEQIEAMNQQLDFWYTVQGAYPLA